MIDFKKIGITATALGAFALASSGALAQPSTYDFVFKKDYDEDVTVRWYNSVSVSLEKSWTISVDISYTGTITISGSIDIDVYATALIDNKQISDFNNITTGGIDNDAWIYDVRVDGNAQINAAAGSGNQQENVAAIAEVNHGSYKDASVEAEVYSLQKLWQNTVLDNGGSNDAYVYNIHVEGNFQANAAAGNLNQQKNALSIAVAQSTVLALASAAVLQGIHFQTINAHGTPNYADVSNIKGTGNAQINAAAGNSNQQLNSLSIAAPSATGP